MGEALKGPVLGLYTSWLSVSILVVLNKGNVFLTWPGALWDSNYGDPLLYLRIGDILVGVFDGYKLSL